MSQIFEKLAPGQPAFTTEVQQGDYETEPALGANEPTALFIRGRFQIYRANYARPAANTTLSYGAATAYFVDDTDFRDLRGGLCEFTRTWATIPASWQEPGGTYAFTFPAYVSPIAFGTLYSVTAAYQNGNYANLMTNAASIAAGDTMLVDLNYVRANQNYHHTFQATAAFAGDGTRVPVANNLPGFGAFSGVSGTLQEVRIGRTTPEAIEVDSFLLHDYAIADETTVDLLLPQVDRFSPVNNSGYAVETLSTGTSTTPNSTTYGSMVAAGTLIVARRSDRRKYAGNIWERTTLVVAAR
jgi:hypothetical protein